MKPEKTGKVLGSREVGSLKVTITGRVSPGRSVNWLGTMVTEAAVEGRGTGPSAAKMVPCRFKAE